MNICCTSCDLSNSDRISLFIGLITIAVLIGTAYVLYQTLIAIRATNEENIRLNRLQTADTKVIKLIEFQHTILEGMQLKNDSGQVKRGREIFEDLLKKFNSIYTDAWGEKRGSPYIINEVPEEINVTDDIQVIKESFWNLIQYKGYGNQFSNYCKNLYYLIRYIDDVKIEGFENKDYARLVKSQLTEYEILFLFYDGLLFDDSKKVQAGNSFKQLIERYGILSALNESNENFLHGNIYKNYYEVSAFGIELQK